MYTRTESLFFGRSNQAEKYAITYELNISATAGGDGNTDDNAFLLALPTEIGCFILTFALALFA